MMTRTLLLAIMFLMLGCSAPDAPATSPSASSDACSLAAKPLLDALNALNSRLTIGMAFEPYTQAVGDAQVAYDRLERSSPSPDCVASVGEPAKKVLADYAKAQTYWANCVAGKCSVTGVQPVLQGIWKDASGILTKIPQT